jgi:hypothetical protein
VLHGDTELQDWEEAEDVPRNHIHRRTDGEVRLRSAFDQVDRLLAGGVPETHVSTWLVMT